MFFSLSLFPMVKFISNFVDFSLVMCGGESKVLC